MSDRRRQGDPTSRPAPVRVGEEFTRAVVQGDNGLIFKATNGFICIPSRDHWLKHADWQATPLVVGEGWRFEVIAVPGSYCLVAPVEHLGPAEDADADDPPMEKPEVGDEFTATVVQGKSELIFKIFRGLICIPCEEAWHGAQEWDDTPLVLGERWRFRVVNVRERRCYVAPVEHLGPADDADGDCSPMEKPELGQEFTSTLVQGKSELIFRIFNGLVCIPCDTAWHNAPEWQDTPLVLDDRWRFRVVTVRDRSCYVAPVEHLGPAEDADADGSPKGKPQVGDEFTEVAVDGHEGPVFKILDGLICLPGRSEWLENREWQDTPLVVGDRWHFRVARVDERCCYVEPIEHLGRGDREESPPRDRNDRGQGRCRDRDRRCRRDRLGTSRPAQDHPRGSVREERPSSPQLPLAVGSVESATFQLTASHEVHGTIDGVLALPDPRKWPVPTPDPDSPMRVRVVEIAYVVVPVEAQE